MLKIILKQDIGFSINKQAKISLKALRAVNTKTEKNCNV